MTLSTGEEFGEVMKMESREEHLPAGFRPPVFAGAANPPRPKAANPAKGLLPSLPI